MMAEREDWNINRIYYGFVEDFFLSKMTESTSAHRKNKNLYIYVPAFLEWFLRLTTHKKFELLSAILKMEIVRKRCSV